METNNNENAPKRKFSNKWIYWPLLLVLVVSNVVLFYNSKDKDATYQEGVLQKDSTIDVLKLEYRASLVRLDDLKSQNANLDSLLSGRNLEINKIKGRIEELTSKQKMSDLEYKEAKSLIASLNDKILAYEGEITRLKEENKQLETKVETLNSTNQQLNEKLDLASIIQAANIELVPINLRRKGTKETETGKAKKVDILRVQFDIVKNLINESSNKELYVLIKTPEGELLTNAALGSGSFVTAEGKSTYYSISKAVYLEQGKPLENVMIDWKQSAPYSKGDYQVDIYYKGHLIGSGKALLK